MSDTDLELLARYARHRAEDAFAELVRRHVDLVYSAARRQVRAPELAEEVAQAVFADLAHQAHQIPPRTVLVAWLYQVTRCTAIDVVRRETSRRLRERVAHELHAMHATTDDWTHIEPLLDEAMHALDDTDRTAVLLRYFENKPLREIGAAMGTSEDAAQKRVSRAIERLREFFAKRGVTVGTSGLAVVLSANAIQAAPAGLTLAISAATALAKTTLVTTATATATQAITMTTLQKTLIAAALATAVGTGIYEARQASVARELVRTLRQQQAALNGQVLQLIRERDEAARRLAGSPVDNERLNRAADELRKLQTEVTRLRAAASATPNDPTEVAMKSWLSRVGSLKQRLAQSPEAGIPELQLLNESDWLSVVKDRSLKSDEDYRGALSALRGTGEHKFGIMLRDALRAFTEANNSQFPANLSQLKPYLDNAAVDDAMLQRYEIVPQDTIRSVGVGSDWVITQRSAVDEAHDNKLVIGAYGYGSTTFLPSDAIREATEAFKQANNGQSPKGLPELRPYLKSEANRSR